MKESEVILWVVPWGIDWSYDKYFHYSLEGYSLHKTKEEALAYRPCEVEDEEWKELWKNRVPLLEPYEALFCEEFIPSSERKHTTFCNWLPKPLKDDAWDGWQGEGFID